jgi:NAD(P)-dependent dehydrogenase (short-subunit alcohol dehydrogenase family)
MFKSHETDFAELFSLKGKVVVITGSTGLLGAEFAKILSWAGADLVLLGHKNQQINKRICENIQNEFGKTPLSLMADLSIKEKVEEVFQIVKLEFGKLDGLVNNAQFVPRKHSKRANAFEDYDMTFWRETIDTNLTGSFLCAQQAGKLMAINGCGSIVNISSIYGMVAPDQRIYGNSGLNAAIINLSKHIAAHYRGTKIRSNSLSLGGVFNSQDPDFVKKYNQKCILGRMASKHEYSAALLFLLSEASSYMTGSNLVIDGGWCAW